MKQKRCQLHRSRARDAGRLLLSQQVVGFLDSEKRACPDRLKADLCFQLKGLGINRQGVGEPALVGAMQLLSSFVLRASRSRRLDRKPLP